VLQNRSLIVAIVRELENIYSDKLLNFDKFVLKFQKCRRIVEEYKKAPLTAVERRGGGGEG
jgi:hypothetical protein